MVAVVGECWFDRQCRGSRRDHDAEDLHFVATLRGQGKLFTSIAHYVSTWRVSTSHYGITRDR